MTYPIRAEGSGADMSFDGYAVTIHWHGALLTSLTQTTKRIPIDSITSVDSGRALLGGWLGVTYPGCETDVARVGGQDLPLNRVPYGRKRVADFARLQAVIQQHVDARGRR